MSPRVMELRFHGIYGRILQDRFQGDGGEDVVLYQDDRRAAGKRDD